MFYELDVGKEGAFNFWGGYCGMRWFDPPISYGFLWFHPPISYGFWRFDPPISYSFSCFYPPILLYLQRQPKRKTL